MLAAAPLLGDQHHKLDAATQSLLARRPFTCNGDGSGGDKRGFQIPPHQMLPPQSGSQPRARRRCLPDGKPCCVVLVGQGPLANRQLWGPMITVWGPSAAPATSIPPTWLAAWDTCSSSPCFCTSQWRRLPTVA